MCSRRWPAHTSRRKTVPAAVDRTCGRGLNHADGEENVRSTDDRRKSRPSAGPSQQYPPIPPAARNAADRIGTSLYREAAIRGNGSREAPFERNLPACSALAGATLRRGRSAALTGSLELD